MWVDDAMDAFPDSLFLEKRLELVTAEFAEFTLSVPTVIVPVPDELTSGVVPPSFTSNFALEVYIDCGLRISQVMF